MGSAASASNNQTGADHLNKNHNHQNGHTVQRVSLQGDLLPQKLPPPFPPRTRKSAVFKESDYKHVDKYVSKLPARYNLGSFKELVDYLTAPHGWDDIAIIRAIFRWVTSVDVFSSQVDRHPPKNSAMEYFLRIRNNHGNHAHLLAALCRLAGIPCVIVSGVNKSAAYEVGKKVDREKMSAQWNMVYVGGNWRFVDAFWASSCIVGQKTGEWTLVDTDGDSEDKDVTAQEGETQHRINEFYFFPDPDQFVWTHFPNHVELQLLAKPVTLPEFEDHFYVRERFHLLEMTSVLSTKLSCVQETQDGQTQLTFGLPAARSSTYRFRYMVYRSRHSVIESKIDLFFDRFVLYERQADLLRFTLRFPIRGSFKIDIYGLDSQDGDLFDLCCTYIINCPLAKENCLPYPDCPPLGWGPVSETGAAGLKPITHKDAEITSKDGLIQIRLAKNRLLAFYQFLKHSLLDEATLIKYSVAEVTENEVVVYLRLPQKGEYALKMFTQDLKERGPALNVLNYLVTCGDTKSDSKPFPNITNGLIGREERIGRHFNVRAISHPQAQVTAKNGRISIEFRADSAVELVSEMHSTDPRAFKEMSSSVRREGEDGWVFDLDMPVSGEYSMNVFAREKEAFEQVYSVHSYLIKSEGGKRASEVERDGQEEEDTSIPTEMLETSEAEVVIPVPYSLTSPVAALHRRNGFDSPNSTTTQFFTAEDSLMVKVRLKSYGEYLLSVFDNQQPGHKMRNVVKYQINRKAPGDLYKNNVGSILGEIKSDNLRPLRQSTASSKSDMNEDQRKQQLRKNIQNAMELKDYHQLEAAIKKFLKAGGSETDSLVRKGKQMLDILRAKADLIEASQRRDTKMLEQAISQAKRVNVNHELDAQIAMAVRLQDHLLHVERLRHTVLNMEPKTVAEIRSYSNPPDGVHQCLMATFLLLGHPLKELKVWQKIQVLLGKTGKESVMRKIAAFDAQVVPLKRAQTAKKMVQPYNKEQIRDVSAGAATFYNWVVGMIEEVENYGGSERADPMRLIT